MLLLDFFGLGELKSHFMLDRFMLLQGRVKFQIWSAEVVEE